MQKEHTYTRSLESRLNCGLGHRVNVRGADVATETSGVGAGRVEKIICPMEAEGGWLLRPGHLQGRHWATQNAEEKVGSSAYRADSIQPKVLHHHLFCLMATKAAKYSGSIQTAFDVE